MKFSILVPVYNVEKYLEQCVESLLSQTYKGEYEIILVDDGSTDSSPEICNTYAEKFPDIVKVIHKENQGLISARDVGIETACGEYCLFVDSDDFAQTDLLKTAADVISENNEPDMVIYSFQYYNNGQISKRKVKIPDKTFSKKDKNYFYEQLISSSAYTSLWTKAVRTEILKNDTNDYSQYYGKNMGEDWLRSIHIFTSANSIVCKNIPLYNYRVNFSSISKTFAPEAIANQNTVHVYKQFRKYLPEWQLDNAEHRAKLKERWLSETIYIFSKFYENAKSNKERKAVVDFNWNSFLPEDFSKEDVCFKNEKYQSLYEMIMKKRYVLLRLHFLKKTLYKKYKNIKSKG